MSVAGDDLIEALDAYARSGPNAGEDLACMRAYGIGALTAWLELNHPEVAAAAVAFFAGGERPAS